MNTSGNLERDIIQEAVVGYFDLLRSAPEHPGLQNVILHRVETDLIATLTTLLDTTRHDRPRCALACLDAGSAELLPERDAAPVPICFNPGAPLPVKPLPSGTCS